MTMSESVGKMPNGPGAAAILAAGIGCAALGVLTFAAEASKAVGPMLNFYSPTGSLSGKTTVAVIVWLVTWFILSRLWKNKNVPLNAINIASFILLGAGFLLTAPPIWAIFLGAR